MSDELSRLNQLEIYINKLNDEFGNENKNTLEVKDFSLSNAHLSEEEAVENYRKFRLDVDSYSPAELYKKTKDLHSEIKDGEIISLKIPKNFNARDYFLRVDLEPYTDSQLKYFRTIKDHISGINFSTEEPVDFEEFVKAHELTEEYFTYIQDREKFPLYQTALQKLSEHRHPKTTKAINNIIKEHPDASIPETNVVSALLISLTYEALLTYLSPLDRQIQKILTFRSKSRQAMMQMAFKPQIMYGFLEESLVNDIKFREGAASKKVIKHRAFLEDQLEQVRKATSLFRDVLLKSYVRNGPPYTGGSGKKKNLLRERIIVSIIDFYMILTGEYPPADDTHNDLFKNLNDAIFEEIKIHSDVLMPGSNPTKTIKHYKNTDDFTGKRSALTNQFRKHSGSSLPLDVVFRFSPRNVALMFPKKFGT